jgi:hypothetical protein
VNETRKRNTETAAENIGRKYPTKQMSKNDNHDNVLEDTKNNVYNAVVSPDTILSVS